MWRTEDSHGGWGGGEGTSGSAGQRGGSPGKEGLSGSSGNGAMQVCGPQAGCRAEAPRPWCKWCWGAGPGDAQEDTPVVGTSRGRAMLNLQGCLALGAFSASG